MRPRGSCCGSRPDLSPAFRIRDWNARGKFVVERLQSVARTSQAALLNELTTRGVRHQSIWIINAVRVDVDATTLKALARLPEVEQIVPEETFHIPPPVPGAAPSALEWGIERIRAPEVGPTFGTRGEGIVVASIDTGVQFDHPALVRQYRGQQGGRHLRPQLQLVRSRRRLRQPVAGAVRQRGHGTHTMGTMVGDDGDPGTTRSASRRSATVDRGQGLRESILLARRSLLASGQWMLAPTDLNGSNPRPDLRPAHRQQLVGRRAVDPFFQPTVQAWVAAGMFPVFSAGNQRSGVRHRGSPGDYPETLRVGAFDDQQRHRRPSPAAGPRRWAA